MADICTSAKVWISHGESTGSQKTIDGGMNPIWDCGFESGISMQRKVFEFGYVCICNNLERQLVGFC
jgi:hypothetical protein